MKKVGTAIYAHVSDIGLFIVENSEKFPNFNKKFTEACNIFNTIKKDNHKPVIIKYDYRANTFSFIACDTFDTLNEPIVGDSYCINLNTGIWKLVKGGNKVYHRKYEFVHPMYKGFDYNASMKRTALVETIPNIKSLKSKIGNKDFWYQLLAENGIEI